MIINVYRIEENGDLRYYPADEKADNLLRLTGKTFFKPKMLKRIEQADLNLKVVKVRNHRSDNHKENK